MSNHVGGSPFCILILTPSRIKLLLRNSYLHLAFETHPYVCMLAFVEKFFQGAGKI